MGASELINPVTGERVVFLGTGRDVNGEFLEFDDYWTRPGHTVPEHVHPQMEESWHVISGSARLRIGGVERTLEAGDVATAPAGTSHMGWNHTANAVHLRVRMRPPLKWQVFTEELFRLAREGLTDDNGLPVEPHLSDLLRRFRREITPPS